MNIQPAPPLQSEYRIGEPVLRTKDLTFLRAGRFTEDPNWPVRAYAHAVPGTHAQ